ncbi:MAG: exodeoxyribonuclease III [Bacillota bacterium]
MRILSWNVNGIRAVLAKGFSAFLQREQPEIICLQEIKLGEKAMSKAKLEFPGYQAYWNGAERAGYSGTAILVKDGLELPVTKGLGNPKFDSEGRVQVLEHNDFYLINAYFPNSNAVLGRLGYKLEFNETLMSFAKKLEEKKPVIITGDFNVAHEEIDIARPKANEGAAGFTKEERTWFGDLLGRGFIDTFRDIYPAKIQYSWWSFRAGARPRNVGWRIDYFVISAKLRKKVKDSFILDQVQGSDHAPIGIEI